MDYSTFRAITTNVPDIILFFSRDLPQYSEHIVYTDLENAAREAQNTLDNMNDPTDEELLVWARMHYPFPDHSEKDRMLAIVEKYNVIKNLLAK